MKFKGKTQLQILAILAIATLLLNTGCGGYNALESTGSIALKSIARVGTETHNSSVTNDSSTSNLTNPLKPFSLNAGQSPAVGSLTLTMQADGNLVLYSSGAALWATNLMPSFDASGFSGPTAGLDCKTCSAVFQ